MAGDRICPCCGSYYGCKCRPTKLTGFGADEKRIADALERLVELLENHFDKTDYNILDSFNIVGDKGVE